MSRDPSWWATGLAAGLIYVACACLLGAICAPHLTIDPIVAILAD
jgi:hypothetical protein